MALERFACHTHNIAVGIAANLGGLSPEQINELEQVSLSALRMLPVQGAPPELSDVLSDEVFQDLKRLIDHARDLRDKA